MLLTHVDATGVESSHHRTWVKANHHILGHGLDQIITSRDILNQHIRTCALALEYRTLCIQHCPNTLASPPERHLVWCLERKGSQCMRENIRIRNDTRTPAWTGTVFDLHPPISSEYIYIYVNIFAYMHLMLNVSVPIYTTRACTPSFLHVPTSSHKPLYVIVFPPLH